MKKTIMWLVLCIAAGISMGVFIFTKYDKDKTTLVSADLIMTNKIYVFQYAVYSNIENLKKLNINYTYEKNNNKYYVYVAMTTNKDNIDKLKKYFEEKDYDIYVKEIDVNNDFYEILKQYDLLLNEATESESIKTILDTTLTKFEEFALDENQRITT